MEIVAGFDEAHRAEVAALFWAAFGGKLGRVLWPRRRALAFLGAIVQPGFALTAMEGRELLGVAGFKTVEGGFMAGSRDDMARHYGRVGAAWRGPLLELFERDLEAGQMLIDGIFVAAPARRRGVGRALVGAIGREAARRGCAEVRLDVAEGNAAARRLYARCGFEGCGTRSTGLLAPLLGFRRAETMRLRVR